MNPQVVDSDGSEPVYTLDEALSAAGFGKFQALVLAYAGLGAMAEAMEVMILSFIGPFVKAEWGLSSGQESLTTTMVFAGMLIGAYFWGFLSDNYGRRVGLLSVAVVTSIFAFFSALSPNYVLLILFRMVVGIGLGGGPVYSTWFLEFVPVQNRGIWMVIFSTFWTVGTILEASLAWIVIPRLGWRWLLAVSSAPCFAAFVLYFFTIETPSEESKCHTSSHPDLLTDSSLYINVFITSLAELPGLVLSAILVDKIGRKMSMLVMYLCGFICLLPLIFRQQQVVAISILFGARMFIIGNYTVAGIYCPELYPTSVRTTGAGVANAVGRVAGMICPLVAVELVSGCHQMAAITLFEIAILLSGISVLFFPIETKGRKLSDTVTLNI
ncbi:organic cation/carnitine transporter 7-like [Salvia divinorum]|uniref:Organic cation/carnitine transporter 7-like n=1 Tax=Salvia divinorum TaxID=28513 RepID=A0ABD1FJY5_SALDI